MFSRLKAWLFGPSRSHPSPTPQERRSQLQRLLEDAERRGDTRAQGWYGIQLRAATLDVLRAEVGR